MRYYEIGVGVERHWKSAVFTYSSETTLAVHEIVRVPFGKVKKPGIVLREVKKPTFVAKPVMSSFGVAAEKETLDFMRWFKDFYGVQNSELYGQLLPNFIGNHSAKDTSSKEHSDKRPDNTLSTAQQKAFDAIVKSDTPTVLRGITGAGKTRIYIELIKKTVDEGKSVLFLYPEISLTTQLTEEIKKHVPALVFHSNMTNKQRSELWHQVAAAKGPTVVAGPRSALFLPHKNLGIVIVDEAHEQSYKQDNDVRYSGLLVAGGLAKVHGAKLVLGSATPPINETELVLKNGGSIVELTEKAIASDYSRKVHISELKDTDQFKKHPLMSDKLIESMGKNIKSSKQTLLFINRRGTAKLLLCEACEWQFECEACDLPMTYHHDIHRMVCHTCGNKQQPVNMCPECGEKTTIHSLGSKALVEEVSKLFPAAKIARFDSDNTKSDSFAERYNEVHSGLVDIVIGTQQLAKGLDLPKLKTVAVLQADLSLHFPDYSSNERTFQLLSQVIGRVGRGHGDAEVYVQTYQPNNPVIQQAIGEDWTKFRENELKERSVHKFPPDYFVAKLLFREKTYDKAQTAADKTASRIRKSTVDVLVDGPLPSFYGKRGGYYYVQIHLKSKKRSALLTACKLAPTTAIKDLDAATLL
jgi:primosomal protein N' (replication factor Y)